MDVTGFGLDPDIDQVVDDLGDVLCAIFLREVPGQHRSASLAQFFLQFFLGQGGKPLGGVVDGLVILRDEFLNAPDRRHADLDVFVERESQLFDFLRVERVAHGHVERAIQVGHRQRLMKTGQADGNLVPQAVFQFEVGQINVIGTDGLRDGLVKGVFVDMTLLDEEIFGRASALQNGLKKGIRLLCREDALINQRGDDEVRVHAIRNLPSSRRAPRRRWSDRQKLSGTHLPAGCACPVRARACGVAPC